MPEAPPLALSIIHFSTCSISIICGSILFAITLTKASQNIASYAILLRCVTLAEISTSIGAFMVFPRIVPLGLEGVACLVSGPIKFLARDPRIWFLYYVLELHGTVQYNVFMTICFCYRYYVLTHAIPTAEKTRRFAACAFSVTFVIFLLFSTCLSPREVTLPYLLHYVPQYVSFQHSYIALIGLTHSVGSLAIIEVMITASAQCFVNIAVGRAIFRHLNDKSHALSERVRATHRQFAVALALQAVIGQLIITAAWCYGLGQLDVVRSPILEYCTHMVLWLPIVALKHVHEFCVSTSPIITLTFVRPYRRKLMSWLHIRPIRITITVQQPTNSNLSKPATEDVTAQKPKKQQVEVIELK